MNGTTETYVGTRNKIQTDFRRRTRWANSLSSTLFNMMINQIINHVRRKQEYRMVFHANYAVLIVDNKDKIQRILCTFKAKAAEENTNISLKNKCMVTPTT